MSLTMNNNAFDKTHTSFLSSEPKPKPLNMMKQMPENNNQIHTDTQTRQVWSLHKFESAPAAPHFDKAEKKMTWANQITPRSAHHPQPELPPAPKRAAADEPKGEQGDEQAPPHHARRPMNAFLIFCKKHRPIVREKFPNLENRSVTKILGEWWALLDGEEKHPFTALAKEHKDAFLTANPDFKWYKLPAPPLRTPTPRPKPPTPLSSPPSSDSEFTPGKLADESQLGGLTSLLNGSYPPRATKTENNNNIEPARPFDDEEEDEPRKSDRKGKGKKYAQFMIEGRLLGNKRDAKLTSQKAEEGGGARGEPAEAPHLDVTIRRLAERTGRQEPQGAAAGAAGNFNLGLRIDRLPCLRYEAYVERKREGKKRKKGQGGEVAAKAARLASQPAVGSRKRKNKRSIMHLGANGGVEAEALLALATLAEVAANERKIEGN